ncbi:MAG: hypothetical protein ABW046_10830 [Actinoplanes sp.]
MKLLPGTTGFLPYRPQGFVPRAIEPADDLRIFAMICREAARRTQGVVLDTRQAGLAPNFHTVVLGYGDRTVSALRHVLLPLVAFVDGVPDPAHLLFTDNRRLTKALGELCHLRVLSSAELRTPLAQVDLSALDTGEMHEIEFWEAETAGQVLFNFWD